MTYCRHCRVDVETWQREDGAVYCRSCRRYLKMDPMVAAEFWKEIMRHV